MILIKITRPEAKTWTETLIRSVWAGVSFVQRANTSLNEALWSNFKPKSRLETCFFIWIFMFWIESRLLVHVSFSCGFIVWNNHTVCWLKLWPRIQNGSAGPSWRAQIRWSCLLRFPRRVWVLSFQLWVSHTKTKTVKSKLWDSSPGGGDSVGFQTYERAPGVLDLLFLSCKHPRTVRGRLSGR